MPRKIRYIQKDHIKNLAGLSAARSTRDGWPSRPPDRRVNGGVKLGHGAAQNWATLGLCGTRVMGGGQSAALSI